MEQIRSDIQRRGPECTSSPLRDLAARGALRRAAASQSHCLQLRAAAYTVAMPLVWERHTRPLENVKGHRRCASGVIRLAPECHDGFTDDLESVVTALLSYRQPIVNLEGWISARMANAIKDGYRVRRATEMGAQQRVRVPVRLAARLDHDPWLIRLAERVLQWVGVRHTAGVGLWPLRAWAEDRIAHAGPVPDPYTAVEEDLDVVLRAMRAIDPAWFDTYVERPLGRKWAPVASGWSESGGAAPPDDIWLQMVPECERDELRLNDAAAGSLLTIRRALASGAEAKKAIAEALTTNFLSIGALRGELDQAPGGHDPGSVVAAILASSDALDRLIPKILSIVG